MRFAVLIAGLGACSAAMAQSTEITVATVNNPDMVTMQSMMSAFNEAYPDIQVNWVTLPENELRQKVTTDIASGAGQYDVVTVSNYETPIWARNDWLVPLESLPDAYDVDDLIAPVKEGLSLDGTLYALPFYAESSVTYYRKDLFEQAGIEMPDKPTWEQMQTFASEIHAPSDGVYGICLRGLPGWGQNMALFGTMVNSFGGRWFDMDWNPQLTSDEWKSAANAYVELLNDYGPPGVTSNGFTESETLFANGQCGMWVDSTVAASYLSDPETSQIADSVGFAQAPYQATEKGSNWLFTWALGIPQSSRNQDAAKTFVEWATSQDYIHAVAEDKGWLSVPPGTRQSTYASEDYVEAAPFAPLVEQAINSASPNDPSAQEVPYTGVQFVTIPQFQAIGTRVGQLMAAMLSGQQSVDEALSQGQTFTERLMQQTGKPE
ncbi:ABC transporter substrate-binding protein [Salinicola avicenniae]|uniref:ABC transporter substrate-binding protein n=1 Tax=Salinicola avicenniae TaxID=2916836 RepID=UPI002073A148|nr:MULTISPECIES: sugar ABC transporter substrate-binding protein [unclassified Salinicola]